MSVTCASATRPRRPRMALSAVAPMVLTHRDRAVLRAVAAGRCRLTGGFPGSLKVDGPPFPDPVAAVRLTTLGLISTSGGGERGSQAAARGHAGIGAACEPLRGGFTHP